MEENKIRTIKIGWFHLTAIITIFVLLGGWYLSSVQMRLAEYENQIEVYMKINKIKLDTVYDLASQIRSLMRLLNDHNWILETIDKKNNITGYVTSPVETDNIAEFMKSMGGNVPGMPKNIYKSKKRGKR